MFDLDALCPNCGEKFNLNNVSLAAKELIQCPHCRRVIKIDLSDPEKKAIWVDHDLVD